MGFCISPRNMFHSVCQNFNANSPQALSLLESLSTWDQHRVASPQSTFHLFAVGILNILNVAQFQRLNSVFTAVIQCIPLHNHKNCRL